VRGFIEELVGRAKRSKVFKRNKKRLEVKILAGLLYFFGLSLRKTSLFMSLFEEISHESVRKYYHRLKYILKQPRKKERILLNEWDGIKPIFPVSSGGLHPGLLPYILEKFGTDVIIQVGGGVMGHPNGVINGARAVRSVIEGLRDGLSLREIARKEKSVKEALELWGTETPI